MKELRFRKCHSSLTLIRRRLSDRLCQSDHEATFVEAVLVQATYKLAQEPGEFLKLTGDQLRQIALARHSDVCWDDRQLERLKAKYFGRPGKPATRFELLRETVKGHRGRNETAGTPSEFLPTGLRVFLAAESHRPGAPDIRFPPRANWPPVSHGNAAPEEPRTPTTLEEKRG